ncbi:glutathione S-transferase [Neisseria zalophi]|uniref:Glutathione S-transferase n=1 Tax=Neisseria zalophi TaxID=640030 RepID=A0A5J6PWD9_9NEIS|nr:glutathione S-transferase [Neisseria zalophi]QEY26574.1 glutathione S-transferase [Neisseria zalophi]
MITLYALKQSRAYRIAWLLELLGVDYDIEISERNVETHFAPESLKKIHPLGKSPMIKDGNLVLAESGAIVEYLINKYGQHTALKPRHDAANYTDYLFWLHYAEGSLMPLLVMSLVFRKIDAQKMPFYAKPIARKITDGVRNSFINPQLKLHLAFIEQSLHNKTWLLGETLTGADIMMGFPLQAALSRTDMTLPAITAYVERIESEPAYVRAEQRIGQLTLL